MTTGARRGEMCGLRWSHLQLDQALMTVKCTVYQDEDGELQEKDTKPGSTDGLGGVSGS
jgi:integrase